MLTSDASPERPGYRDRVYERYGSVFRKRPTDARLDASFEQHARFFDYLFGPFFAQTRPREILDIGCGQGALLFWIRSRGLGSARGVDLSVEQVNQARSLGLAAEVAAAEDYLARCGTDFDLIVGLDLIEHFTRDEAFRVLEQCAARLRPGGHLLLMTPNGAALRPGPVVTGDLTHETIYSPRTIRLALELTGFDDVQIREVVPPPFTVRSRVRRLLWRLVRLVAAVLDLVETGTASPRVYSRVMVVEARRP